MNDVEYYNKQEEIMIEESIKIKDSIIKSINRGEDLRTLLNQVNNILGRTLSYDDRMEALAWKELLRYKIGFEECMNILNPDQIHIIKKSLKDLNLL